ncbi:MAG: hypothetical protein U0790_12610 [Isosphaeraceae bacterium]
MTEQLSKWHRQSLEARSRDAAARDQQATRGKLTPEELDRPETRRRIETRRPPRSGPLAAALELVGTGEDLVQQAMRNPEFGVGHLEKWAEMLQILGHLGTRNAHGGRPLKQASQAQAAASSSDKPKTPMAGMVRDTRSGQAGKEPAEAKKAASGVPQVVDRESSQQPLDENSPNSPPPPAGKGRLTLPVTTLAGKAPKGNESCPTAQKLDEAVTRQQDLLAEFEKIADELNRVLANLEGSTLVKRLKAASRLQYTVAGRMIDLAGDAFGLSAPLPRDGAPKTVEDLSKQEAKGSQDVSIIMDDMQSYFERRRFMQFKTVLDEMRKLDVIGNLRQLGDDLKKENGLSIAQCEYWSDTLDRWADDLVDPLSGGT